LIFIDFYKRQNVVHVVHKWEAGLLSQYRDQTVEVADWTAGVRLTPEEGNV